MGVYTVDMSGSDQGVFDYRNGFFQEHVAFSNKLPFLLENGFRILPRDTQEASGVIIERGSPRIVDFRKVQLTKLELKARRLSRKLRKIRGGLGVNRFDPRALLHAPLLREPAQTHDTGGADWCDQFVRGFSMLGDLAELGVFTSNYNVAEPT